MNSNHVQDSHCSHCGNKLTFKEWLACRARRGIAFFCAACLVFLVAITELPFFGKMTSSQPLTNMSTEDVQFMFASSGGSGDVHSDGDRAIDFRGIYDVPFSQFQQSIPSGDEAS